MKRWVLALCVGCRQPCPPPTVIIQQAPAPAPVPPVAETTPTDTTLPPRPAMPISDAQVAIAARLDEEGRKLYDQKLYGPASTKFREAIARDPDAKYFFNLCQSLFQEGRFTEALTACDAVSANASPDLSRNTKALTQRILDEARAQSIHLRSR